MRKVANDHFAYAKLFFRHVLDKKTSSFKSFKIMFRLKPMPNEQRSKVVECSQ